MPTRVGREAPRMSVEALRMPTALDVPLKTLTPLKTLSPLKTPDIAVIDLQAPAFLDVPTIRKASAKTGILPQQPDQQVRYGRTMSRPTEDWQLVLEGFEKNDALAIAKVTDVIVGYLHRFRAHDRRSSWDDLIQDVLMALLRTVRRDGLRDPAAFVAYTGTVTRNTLTNFATRRDRKDRNLPWSDELANASQDNDHREAPSRRSEVAIDIERALHDLEPRCREVVANIYLEGFSYAETATRLSISLAAVKREQIKGLKVLRERLGIQR
jgi:RNA polymerase sigma factor (sigma-70 family)